MDGSVLTMEERDAINQGRWFSSLSSLLRHDILRCASVKRYQDGELIAARAKDAGIDTVVFDRGGNAYHGRIAAVADGAREGGLQL